jgi:hypothetical protein
MKKILLILFLSIFTFSFLNAKVYQGEISQINNSQIILNKTGMFNSLFNFIGFKNQEIININNQTKYFLKQDNKEINFHDLKIGMYVLINTQETNPTKTSETVLKNNTYDYEEENNLSLFDLFSSKIQNFSLPPTTQEEVKPTSQCSNIENYVCGKDGKTYLNECMATEAKIIVDCLGKCPCKKTYTFNFLNIFNTTKPQKETNKIVYKSLDDYYAQYQQEKNKKTNKFLKDNQPLLLKEIISQEEKIEAMVYPNKAIPNETIAFSINPKFLLNKIYFPLHENEIDKQYSGLDDFETKLMFSIFLKDPTTNEVVATIQNKNRDYIRWLQNKNDHLGFTFRVIYDEKLKGYILSSPYKTEHNKNTELVSPVEDPG